MDWPLGITASMGLGEIGWSLKKAQKKEGTKGQIAIRYKHSGTWKNDGLVCCSLAG